MSWYNTKEQYPEQIHVVNTKVRFFRNQAKIAFTTRTDKKTASEITLHIGNILEANGFHAEPTDGKGIIPLLACEAKQYIDSDFIYSSMPRALYFNEPCSLNIAIGGLDLLLIQSMLPGISVKETFATASSAEEALDGEIDFAYSKKYGYLSAHPNHSGSGLMFSSLLFLPALSISGKTDFYSHQIHLKPLYQNNCLGYLYELEYYPDANISESSAISYFENTIKAIVQTEKENEKQIYRSQTEIFDRASRACAIFDYSQSISESELLTLLSDLRLFLAINRDNSLRHKIDINFINCLLVEGVNNSLAVSLQKLSDNIYDYDIERAKFINTYLAKYI